MLFQIIFRDLRDQGAAWGLKVFGLASAVAMLLVASLLVERQHVGALPGSSCADRIVSVGLRLRGLAETSDRLTMAQMRVLGEAIPDLQHSAVVQGSGLVSTIRGYKKAIVVEAVEAGFFDMVCVEPEFIAAGSQTQHLAGAVITKNLGQDIGEDTPFERFGGPSMPITGTLDHFDGITPESRNSGHKTQAWVPLGASVAPTATGNLIINLPAGMNASELAARLAPVLETRKALFDDAKALIIVPAGMTASQVQIYRYSSWAMRSFGWMLLLLTIVSVACHQYGRIEQTSSLARIMTAVGTPPRQIWILAIVEPVLMAVVALFGGYLIARLVLRMIPASNDWTIGFRWLPEVGMLLCVPLSLLIFLRGRLLLARAAPSVGHGWRILHVALPLILFVQVALATLATGLALQMAVQAHRNHPPDPLFQLDGLTYLVVRQEAYKAPPQNHLAERWNAIWQENPIPGFKVALASRHAPFLGEPPRDSMRVDGEKFLYRKVGVSPDFFKVLGVENPPVVDSNAFVVNRVLQQHLTRYYGESPLLTILGADGLRATRQVTATVDDGVLGNPHATYDFAITNELDVSNQLATPPTAYQLLQGSLDSKSPLSVVVRHPASVSSTQAASQVLPRLQQLLPSAQLTETTSARQLLTQGGEETASMVAMLIASATLSAGGFGLLALLAMFMRSMRVEILLANICGVTKSSSLQMIIRRCSGPYLLGIGVGLLPVLLMVWLQSSNFAQVNTTVSWYGPLLAVALLLTILAWAIWTGAKSFRRNSLIAQLRHE